MIYGKSDAGVYVEHLMQVTFIKRSAHSASLFGMSVGPESGKSIAAMIGDHGCCTWRPARWADLSVLVSVLEGLNETDDLIDIPSDGQVVNAVLAKSAFFVDDVSCAECDTCVITILD